MSHHITSHHITSHHITSHDIISHRNVHDQFSISYSVIACSLILHHTHQNSSKSIIHSLMWKYVAIFDVNSYPLYQKQKTIHTSRCQTHILCFLRISNSSHLILHICIIEYIDMRALLFEFSIVMNAEVKFSLNSLTCRS